MLGHPAQGHHIVLFQSGTPKAIVLPGRGRKECSSRWNSDYDIGITNAQHPGSRAVDVAEKPLTNLSLQNVTTLETSNRGQLIQMEGRRT